MKQLNPSFYLLYFIPNKATISAVPASQSESIYSVFIEYIDISFRIKRFFFLNFSITIKIHEPS